MIETWDLFNRDDVPVTEVDIWETGEALPESLWTTKFETGLLTPSEELLVEIFVGLDEQGGLANISDDEIEETVETVVRRWDAIEAVETELDEDVEEWKGTIVDHLGESDEDVLFHPEDIGRPAIEGDSTRYLMSSPSSVPSVPVSHGDWVWVGDQSERQHTGSGLEFTQYRSQFLETENGYDFHAIAFPFWYTKKNPFFTRYKQMFVRLSLAPTDCQAFDLLPRPHEVGSTMATEYTVSAGLKFTPLTADISASWSIEVPVVTPVISPFGRWGRRFGWWYHPTVIQSGTEVSVGITPGDRICGVVLRTPEGMDEISGTVAYDFAWRRKGPEWVTKNATAGKLDFNWELPSEGYVMKEMNPIAR
ncbi:hypothetical protein [Natrinema gelatinilyticum]|uniref:hypothetical protein n=1 Tax=Natrinema gelatinilyticum TaxID=2961571 RepID=UPI0020C2FA73|nr:hypothetical protein [Natrinema gelatinilyticum]